MSKRKKSKKNNNKNINNAISVPFGIKHVSKRPKYIENEKFDEKLLMTIFKHPDNQKYQHEFSKFVFDPNLWGKYNEEYKIKFEPSKIKGMRILIQIGTINAILRGKYFVYNDKNKQKNEDDVKSNIKYKIIEIPKRGIIDSVCKTVVHFEDQLFDKNFLNQFETEKKEETTKIMLINNDILDVAKYIMIKYHIKPLVLVMSSRTFGGGGYKIGAGAQEEDICRRSTLFCNLEDPYNYRKNHDLFNGYPLPEYGGIYSKNVIVFRNGINKNYSFYSPNPLKMSFVSVYSYSSPSLDENNNLSKTMEKRTIKKIETIFRIAIKHNHRCVILSAFGSGSYENPPQHIAKLFKYVINKKQYKKYFKMIVFAIIDDKNTGKAHNPKGNVIPYSQVFNIPILNLSKMDILQ